MCWTEEKIESCLRVTCDRIEPTRVGRKKALNFSWSLFSLTKQLAVSDLAMKSNSTIEYGYSRHVRLCKNSHFEWIHVARPSTRCNIQHFCASCVSSHAFTCAVHLLGFEFLFVGLQLIVRSLQPVSHSEWQLNVNAQTVKTTLFATSPLYRPKELNCRFWLFNICASFCRLFFFVSCVRVHVERACAFLLFFVWLRFFSMRHTHLPNWEDAIKWRLDFNQ